jgi:hypothetical protein
MLEMVFQLRLVAQGRGKLRGMEVFRIGSIAWMTVAPMAAHAVEPVPDRGAAKC